MSEPRPLHPAAVLAETLDALRQLLLPLLLLAVLGSGGTIERILFYGVAGVVLATAGALVQWRTTRWWVDAAGVRLRRGVFNRREITIPVERVQAVGTVRGPVQRLFGVVELHVQAAGGGRSAEIVLKALAPDDAAALRALVARRADAVDAPPAGEAAAVPAWRLERRPLLVAAATSGSVGVLAPVLAGASQVVDDVLSPAAAQRLLPDTPEEVALLALAVVGLAWLLSFLGTIVGFAGFEVRRERDRLLIGRGFVQRREASVPVERVHAVRVIEGPLRQPLGLAAVRLETAGYANEAAAARTLLPLVRRADVQAVLGRLLPELTASLDALEPPPARARRRFVSAPLLASLVVAVPVAVAVAPAGLLALALIPAAAALGIARHRAAGWRIDGDRVLLRGRRIARMTTIARTHRLQLVTRRVSPFQRRGRLATLAVALSSRRRSGVAHLDVEVADRLLARLVAAASAR